VSGVIGPRLTESQDGRSFDVPQRAACDQSDTAEITGFWPFSVLNGTEKHYPVISYTRIFPLPHRASAPQPVRF